jgi:hypothetical protein
VRVSTVLLLALAAAAAGNHAKPIQAVQLSYLGSTLFVLDCVSTHSTTDLLLLLPCNSFSFPCSTPNTMADALQAAAAADQLTLLMAMQQHQQQSQLQAAAAAASAAAAAMPPMPLGMGMPAGATVDQLQMLLSNPAEMNRYIHHTACMPAHITEILLALLAPTLAVCSCTCYSSLSCATSLCT